MVKNPKVGMSVELNDHGLELINGLRTKEEIKDSMHMIITGLTEIPCNDCKLYDLEFEGNSVGRYMLTNYGVDET